MRLTNALPMDDGLALLDVVDFDGEFAIDVDLFVVAERKKIEKKNISKLPFSLIFYFVIVSILAFRPHESQSLAP
jgi:hypothetical protein